MPNDDFQTAAARAEAACASEIWFAMPARAQAAAIYRELRELDQRSAGNEPPVTPTRGLHPAAP